MRGPGRHLVRTVRTGPVAAGRRWNRGLGSLLLLAGLAAACSSSEALPDGAQLVRRSAEAMKGVSSVRFSLQLEGELGILGIRNAEGVLTRAGEASGTVQLDPGTGLIEYEVVITDGTYYLKGATGGFQEVPSFLSSQLYNPTLFLDPDVGFAAVLAAAKDARTKAAESVEGTAGYRVEATIPSDLLQGVVPLDPDQREVPASLWIGKSDPVLLQVRVVTQPEDASGSTTLTLTLTDPNLRVEITAPSS
jgi:lipoprotein LprG